MSEGGISNTEALVRALWLVNNGLVDIATKGVDNPSTVLKMRLKALGLPDERVFARTAERFCEQPPTLIENLYRLCGAMFERRQGLPLLRSGPLFRRIIRLVDPDALVCLDALSLPADECFDWGAIPLRDDGKVTQVLRDGSIDTHIHLGGALPPLFFWVALMGGELPLEILLDFPAKHRAHASKEQWQQAVAQAMWLRLSLAAELQKPSSLPGGPVFRWLPSSDSEEREPPASVGAIRDAVLRLSAPVRLNWSQRRGWPFLDPLRLPDSTGCHYAEGERRLLFHLGQRLRQPSMADGIEDPLLKYRSVI